MAVFTVLIPSYNAEKIIGATIASLVAQTFTDWECLVVDDGSTDGTEAAVRAFTEPRITFIKNPSNLGCAGNFQRARDLATGTYVYFLANDDILSPRALERTLEAFRLAPDIGAVTRPYYWFENNNPETVVRYTTPIDPKADRIFSADDTDVLRAVFDTLGQVTGMAFRNDALTTPFSPYVFTTHIQPFLSTLRTHRAVFMHDYLVAVRIESSQTRTLPKIYEPSPLWTWVNMMDEVFAGKRWERTRRIGRDNIASHVEGMVQIRFSSTFGTWLREAWLYLLYRPANALSIKFWIFTFSCLLIPPRTLRRLVDRLIPIVTRRRAHGIALTT